MRARRRCGRTLAVVAFLLAMGAPGRAAAPPKVGIEEPVTPVDGRGAASHNSPMLAVDPTESRFVVVAYRLDAPELDCGLHVSGDGGRTWLSARPVPDLPAGVERCYAPEIAFDRNGTLYYLFIGLAGRGNEPVGVFLTKSTDRARSFAAPWKLLGPENYQARLAIDRDAGRLGRIHLVWLHAASDAPLGAMPDGPNPILAAHSDDGGRTFTEPVRVSEPVRARAVAPAVALGPDHAVRVAYYDLQDDARDYQGLEGPTWDGHWSVVVATSRDGGRTFSQAVVDDAIVPPGRVMLIFTMPPPAIAVAGPRAIVAWSDGRNGDADVFIARSTVGGDGWGRPQRVNDDAIGNGRDQLLPRLAVAPGGRVDLVFLDRRDDPMNQRFNVTYASAPGGGAPFSPSVSLTTRSSSAQFGQRYLIPSAEGLIELGSRLALLSGDRSVVAVWPDTRNATGGAQQDLYSSAIDVPRRASPAGGLGRWWWAAAAAVLFAGAWGGTAAARRRARPARSGA